MEPNLVITVISSLLIISGLVNIFQEYRVRKRNREIEEMLEETQGRVESAKESLHEILVETRRESDFKLQQAAKQIGRAIAALPVAKGTKSTIIVRVEEIISNEIQRGFSCDSN